jgi:hypothetical protein
VIPTTSYFASPSYRCHVPGRSFGRAQEALEFARQVSEAFRVSFSVYRVCEGRASLLWRFDPGPGAA